MREDKFQLSSSRDVFMSEQSSSWMNVVGIKADKSLLKIFFLVLYVGQDILASQ